MADAAERGAEGGEAARPKLSRDRTSATIAWASGAGSPSGARHSPIAIACRSIGEKSPRRGAASAATALCSSASAGTASGDASATPPPTRPKAHARLESVAGRASRSAPSAVAAAAAASKTAPAPPRR